MALIDFVKGAGEKLFGEAGAQAATPSPAVETHRATTLEAVIAEFGLPIDDLKIKIAGDTAHIRGTVASPEVREKVVLAVGNTAGIARVNDDRLAVTGGGAEATFHTVTRGDTLSQIARNHYGRASQYTRLVDANRPMLTDPDRIYPGQVLRIPPKDA